MLPLVDASNPADEMDDRLLSAIQTLKPAADPIAFNKTDRLNKAALSNCPVYTVKNCRKRCKFLPGWVGGRRCCRKLWKCFPGPQYYPEEQVTGDFERDIAAEMIRAVCMELLTDEIPYAIATQVQSYKERENGTLFIEAEIFVERDNQKAIVIGNKGQMIREIGTKAREKLEQSTGQKVFLDLIVKVKKNWKNDPDFLKQIGIAGG